MQQTTYTLTVASSVLLAGAASTLNAAATAVPAPPANPKWEVTAAAGLTLTDGNSDTILLTGNVLGTRKSKMDEWALGVDGAYGEDSGDKNNETLHGFIQYNRLLSDRLYIYGRVDGLHDGIADIDYRFTFSPGVGYYFIKTDKTRLSGEVGPGFVTEKQGGRSRSYWTLRVAERFEHKFNEKTKIWQSLEWLPAVDDFNDYILNGEVGLDTALTQKLSLRTFLQNSYDNTPAPGRERNDLKLVTGLAYKF
jgi:putative salt-induced outer membrane protein YdiY